MHYDDLVDNGNWYACETWKLSKSNDQLESLFEVPAPFKIFVAIEYDICICTKIYKNLLFLRYFNDKFRNEWERCTTFYINYGN